MRAGLVSIFAASSMNALPRPSSSLATAACLPALRDAKSPISLALFSAAEASESASWTGSKPAPGAGAAAGRLEVGVDIGFTPVRADDGEDAILRGAASAHWVTHPRSCPLRGQPPPPEGGERRPRAAARPPEGGP